MDTENLLFKIVSYKPTNSNYFLKLADAYNKLFNEKNSLKFLSLTDVPLDLHTIYSFLKNASVNEVDYQVAISPENEIIGISAFESDIIKGFNVIGMVVDSNYRGHDIGTSLINKGIEIANNKGFKAIDISVFADNKAMLLLLIKMDFKPIKIEYHVRSDGEDLVHLKKYL